MAARYKSAFASASGFCSANAAQRTASPAVSSKKAGPVADLAEAAPKSARMKKRVATRPARRAA